MGGKIFSLIYLTGSRKKHFFFFNNQLWMFGRPGESFPVNRYSKKSKLKAPAKPFKLEHCNKSESDDSSSDDVWCENTPEKPTKCQLPCQNVLHQMFYEPSQTNQYLWKVPRDVCVLFVSAVGGGGAGSNGSVTEGGMAINCCGGGGWSGESVVDRPVYVSPSSELLIRPGRGGGQVGNSSLDGQDSLIAHWIHGSQESVLLRVAGGKAYHLNSPPSPLDVVFSSRPGGQASTSLVSQPLCLPGDGGASFFASGGRGGRPSTNHQSFIGQPGYFGSGGGGGLGGIQKENFGLGGHGFIKIQYTSCYC
jgi:hypothetical protein